MARLTQAQKAGLAKARAARAAKTMARKAATIARAHSVSANRAASVAAKAATIARSMSPAASTTRKSPVRAMKTLSTLRKSITPVRRVIRKKSQSALMRMRAMRRRLRGRSPAASLHKRRYTMRMARAVYSSPGQTPMRARRHKHLDKYRRRIFIGPRGGKFALRPRGSRVYHVQENGRRYPLYGVYRKTSSGAIKMLKKFLGVFTTKRRLLKK